MSDLISRQAAIDWLKNEWDGIVVHLFDGIESLPSAQPERLTDDDFETIRIHLNAYKEKLCNQQRWEEAEEYQCIIDRFMAFASAQSECKRGRWVQIQFRTIPHNRISKALKCSVCGKRKDKYVTWNFCPNCGADMRKREGNNV